MRENCCHRCGRPLTGAYLIAFGAKWHPEHFLCSRCQKPIGYGVYQCVEGQPVHPSCFCCSYCQNPLPQSYRKDLFGNTYCPEHEAEWAQCLSCMRLVPGTSARADDALCSECQRSGIFSLSRALPLLAGSQQWLARFGLHTDRVQLELQSPKEIRKILGRSHTGKACGAFSYEKTGRRNSKISVVRGLNPLRFQGVTVHELGHFWLHQNRLNGISVKLEEGFCEFLRHEFFLVTGSELALAFAEMEISNSCDPIYGDGFREIYELIANRGFKNFRDNLIRTRRFSVT